MRARHEWYWFAILRQGFSVNTCVERLSGGGVQRRGSAPPLHLLIEFERGEAVPGSHGVVA